MEKISAITPKGEGAGSHMPGESISVNSMDNTSPSVEPNNVDKLMGEEEKAHSHEPERVVEWGGPNNRYGKVERKEKKLTNLLLINLVKCHFRQRSVQSCLEGNR